MYAAIVPTIFQCLFQYTLDISNTSGGRYINSKHFWINCYNIVKFGTNCLLLCIFLDYLDAINFVWCVFFILKWCGYLCWIVRLFYRLRLLFFFWTLSWCLSYVWIYFDLFGLPWNLNKVGEINKICVDIWHCLVWIWWTIICFELISWLK
jgi:hypothetical protein